MSTTHTPCPECGGELELKLGIWAKDIIVEDGKVASCAPAESSDYDDGINGADEFAVSCTDCGHVLENVREGNAPGFWVFQREPASNAELVRLLKAGAEALDYQSEDLGTRADYERTNHAPGESEEDEYATAADKALHDAIAIRAMVEEMEADEG